jgi:hypothetical protein
MAILQPMLHALYTPFSERHRPVKNATLCSAGVSFCAAEDDLMCDQQQLVAVDNAKGLRVLLILPPEYEFSF